MIEEQIQAKRKILFWGDDPDYINEAKRHYRKLGDYLYEFVATAPTANKQSLFELVKEVGPDLVFIDFTHHYCPNKSIFSDIVYLRKAHPYRSIVFVGIFKNKSHLKFMIDCIHYGIHFVYIKGVDIRELFIDATYITYKEENNIPPFARARNLKIDHYLEQLGFVSQFSSESIKINCNLNIPSSETNVRFPFLTGRRTHRFNVVEKYLAAELGSATHSYLLHFNYSQPSSEIEPGSLIKEDVEIRIENYGPHFSVPHRRFLIHTYNQDIIEALIKRGVIEGEDIQLEQSNLLNRISTLKPEAIIIDYSPSEHGEFEDIINPVISCIKNMPDYRPTLLIFNSPLANKNFKDHFNFFSLCDLRPCSVESLQMIMGIYINKKSFTPSQNIYEFEYEDTNIFAFVEVPVTITSISEHELTFLSDHELTDFSIFKIEVPVDAYILVVPSYFPLPKSTTKQFHYTGILMGLDFFESNNLRRFVNQVIFEPTKPLKIIEVPEEGLTLKKIEST